MGWLATGVGSVAFSWVGWVVCLVVGGEGQGWSFWQRDTTGCLGLAGSGWMDGWMGGRHDTNVSCFLCWAFCFDQSVRYSMVPLGWYLSSQRGAIFNGAGGLERCRSCLGILCVDQKSGD